MRLTRLPNAVAAGLAGLTVALTVVLVTGAAEPAGAPIVRAAALTTGLPGGTRTVALGSRAFVLHVPPRLTGPAPLVLALHGFLQSPDHLRRDTGLEALADRAGFVVAFPLAVGAAWAAGSCCTVASTSTAPFTSKAIRPDPAGEDDVDYLDAVVRATRERVDVDPGRIGVTGFSNGAMPALRYACERSGMVSAVAVVAGVLVAPCHPDHPVPVLELYGADDTSVPLAGGVRAALGAVLPPVDRSIDPLRAAGGEVQLRVLPGVRHQWLPGDTDLVWSWLSSHRRT